MNEAIAIVILAAGESSRMGRPKQLLKFGSNTFIEHSFRIATAVTGIRTCIILGAFANEIIASTPLIKNNVQINDAWKTGMGSSIKNGIEAVKRLYPEVNAVLFITCDMPAVKAVDLQQIIDQHISSGKAIVASSYQESAGIPALFAASMFPTLLAIKDDRGAKQVIDTNREHLSLVTFPGKLDDVDTPEQYDNLLM